MILVAGGASDPHHPRLIAALERAACPYHRLLWGPTDFPKLRYRVPEGVLEIEGAVVQPQALWLRHDVFTALHDPREAVVDRAQAWFDAVLGWAFLRPELRFPNRRALQGRVNKVAQLAQARACGLRIPLTEVGTELWDWEPAQAWVAKPVSGGGYCRSMAELLEGMAGEAVAAQPAFIQNRLGGPELRVYLIGAQIFCWEILTDVLDHRCDPQAGLRAAILPQAETDALKMLAEQLGLDIAAADFKRDPQTGDLVFLEINTQPMWLAYDIAAQGALADAMVAWLTQ